MTTGNRWVSRCSCSQDPAEALEHAVEVVAQVRTVRVGDLISCFPRAITDLGEGGVLAADELHQGADEAAVTVPPPTAPCEMSTRSKGETPFAESDHQSNHGSVR
ncbi:hypothetical protein [Streptomyces sp. XH2]|uniref:hypothetical protein n=1 Tax=Streptomyces sp. XH2 TaxID=3412483 RepID=UPI003C7C299E